MDLLDLLPHRPPMRLLDAIVDLVPGQSACGRRDLRPDDFFFDGHFPGEPIVPAVMLVEMIAQVAAWRPARPTIRTPAPRRCGSGSPRWGPSASGTP